MKLRVVLAPIAAFVVFVAGLLTWTFRKTRRWLLILAVVCAAFVGVKHVHGWWSVRQEWGAWETAGMPLRTLSTRYPASPNSSSALELDELTRPLGIVLISSRESDSPRDRMTDQTPLLAIKEWVDSLEEKQNDRVESLPPDVEAFVSEHRGAVSRIVAHLLTSETIVWEQDIDASPRWAAPILNVAHHDLQSVVIAYAISNSLDGRQDVAADALNAVWRHYDSTRTRPDFISQMVAAGLAAGQNAALRQLRYVTSKWDERIASYDSTGALVRSLQLEAYVLLSEAAPFRSLGEWADPNEYVSSRSFLEVLGERILTSGMVRGGSAETSRRLRWASERIRSGAICELDPEALAEEAESLGLFSVIPRILLPTIYRPWDLFLHSDLDGELTGMVLEARRTEEMATPLPNGSTRPSRVCTSVMWRYQTQPDGTLSIRAEGEIPPGTQGIEQFRFTMSR